MSGGRAGDHRRGDEGAVGLWDGSTENKTVVRALLADPVGRGLGFDDGLLVVIDGAKAPAVVREGCDNAVIQDVLCRVAQHR